jgi:hypothetical protein
MQDGDATMDPAQGPIEVIMDCDSATAKLYTQVQRVAMDFLQPSLTGLEEGKQTNSDQIQGKQIGFSTGANYKMRQFACA